MKTPTDILTRRVEKVLPSTDGLAKLMAAKKIRLYQGFDPTGLRLHLGHTIGLRKLMEFANLGHEVIFLFGTGTVLAGDPSQRDSARKLITQEEIDTNIKNWQDQVAPIVDFDKIKIMQNGDWLTQLTLKDIIHIGSNISAVQLFKRDSFQRRLDKGDTVWFHETMYPLLQGYDSVAMDVDLEIGGTDQEFNMLVGRELQRKMNNREKFVLTVPLIAGVDGEPMSKTRSNGVWLTDTPEDMYGKLMAINDRLIVSYFELLTDIPLEEIENLPNDPLANKKRLAFDITRQIHGQNKALEAQKNFEHIVQQRQTPENLKIRISSLSPNVDQKFFDIVKTHLELEKGRGFQSNGQIKRVIEQGGVELDGKTIKDPQKILILEPNTTYTLKFGKRLFIKFKTL